MAKFKGNEKLQVALKNIATQSKINTITNIPSPDTRNINGHEAYTKDNWSKLISMLLTLKITDQFYRSENKTIEELKTLIDKCAKENAYLTAQTIVYARCVENMRSVNHLAAAFLAPYISGTEWGKRFYSAWNKNTQSGGCIYRPDDMLEITSIFSSMNTTKLTNAMKKGFSSVLENLDSYRLLKYKSKLIDVINITHPNSKKSNAFVEHNNEQVKVLDAIIKGLSVSADTWEVAQSEAGQIVASAVKEGKITETEAASILTEAKADNWEELLNTNKLGILAAIRNIRNILKTVTKSEVITKLCNLLANEEIIKAGKIMPYHFDLAVEILKTEFNTSESRIIINSLTDGYLKSIPNLAELLPGNNLVIIDMSASMNAIITNGNNTKYSSSCLDKGCLLGTTIALSTNADIIRFGTRAEYVNYNPTDNVFSLAQNIKRGMGCTSLASAWKLIREQKRKYDRVFIFSDNECNNGNQFKEYTNYVYEIGNPYVYSVDLCGYGTNALAGDKLRYYYGYGLQLFEDITKCEINPLDYLEVIKTINI